MKLAILVSVFCWFWLANLLYLFIFIFSGCLDVWMVGCVLGSWVFLLISMVR